MSDVPLILITQRDLIVLWQGYGWWIVLVMLALMPFRRWLPFWKNGLLGESWTWRRYDGPNTFFLTFRLRGTCMWVPSREEHWLCHTSHNVTHKPRRIGRRERKREAIFEEAKRHLQSRDQAPDSAPAANGDAPRGSIASLPSKAA